MVVLEPYGVDREASGGGALSLRAWVDSLGVDAKLEQGLYEETSTATHLEHATTTTIVHDPGPRLRLGAHALLGRSNVTMIPGIEIGRLDHARGRQGGDEYGAAAATTHVREASDHEGPGRPR